jgi:hypothetical protein
MTPEKHSPLPWKFDQRPLGKYLLDADGSTINLDYEPNQELIIQAVNSHASLLEKNKKLVGALKNLREAVSNRQRKHDCPGFDCAICTPGEELFQADQVLSECEVKE